jgi:rhodanese-related sulfurtransferase
MKPFPVRLFPALLAIVSRGSLMAMLCLLLGAAAVTGVANAQSANGMPEALKNIKQATGMCMRDDVATVKPAAGGIVAYPQPDVSCAMAPADLLPQLGRADTVLIDTRLAAEYAAYRIDEALNMSVSELRSKPFLHAKNVVLIGDGKAERELYAACAALKTEGFKQVRVLRGGMPVWLLGRHAVLGRALDASQSIHLNPSELWGESQFDANLLLLTRSQAGLQQQLPTALLIQEASAAELKRAIEQRREQIRKQIRRMPLAAVILVTAGSLTTEDIQRLYEAAQPLPLLIYSGAAEAYMRQVAQQKAIWSAQASGPKQLGCGL